MSVAKGSTSGSLPSNHRAWNLPFALACRAADVRGTPDPAMSIGDRAGSLPAELSIDWNTGL